MAPQPRRPPSPAQTQAEAQYAIAYIAGRISEALFEHSLTATSGPPQCELEAMVGALLRRGVIRPGPAVRLRQPMRGQLAINEAGEIDE